VAKVESVSSLLSPRCERLHLARSPIFTDETSLRAVLDAGSRAVYSYPLLSGGRVLGVLSFHHLRPVAHDDGAGLVAYSAAHALARSA
jgi:hypothetical protein